MIGKILNVARSMDGGFQVTLNLQGATTKYIDRLLGYEQLEVKLDKYTEKRSLNANALLWSCLNDLSSVRDNDNWGLYLEMLRKYGQKTYICVKPNVVNEVKKQWRECEVIGEVDINGQKAVQMLCYFGSSTYNKDEFKRLLDGVIKEMIADGLQPPPSKDMLRALKELEDDKRTI